MSGITIKFKEGPVTFKAEAAVTGGQVVQAGTGTRTIVPATAGSKTAVGVAINDAEPKGDTYTGEPEWIGVAHAPAQVPVTSDGTVAVGDVVIAAAGGTVTKAAGTETVDQIIGRVIEVHDANIVQIRLYV